jgi:hypothetical protein
MDYGGGYSTDVGPLGWFEISNVDLMTVAPGSPGLRIRPVQQRLRFEYLDPRLSLNKRQLLRRWRCREYERDSTITRFFRSAIDRGPWVSFSGSTKTETPSTYSA